MREGSAVRAARPVTIVIALVAVLLGVLALSEGPALAGTVRPHDYSGTNYVALGDSYSSGVGAGDYTSESGDCDRSPNAYSALWAAANSPASYTSVACSGAKTTDVNSTQLSALSDSTTLVSITIGGNDVGFSNIIETCVLDGTDDCVSAVQQAEDFANANLSSLLGTTYSGIASDAPNAEVVVLGYPVFYDLSVSGCIGLSDTSRAKIDEGISLVDSIIADTAQSYGFTYADVTPAFDGHQICDDSPWLHSLNFTDVSESYHPTADGHADAYYPTFSAAV